MAHIATCEEFVSIPLAELLLLWRLIVPWRGSWKMVGCLLLLRRPNNPSSCLLLKSSTLTIGDNQNLWGGAEGPDIGALRFFYAR
jgi:hypothetical protein